MRMIKTIYCLVFVLTYTSVAADELGVSKPTQSLSTEFSAQPVVFPRSYFKENGQMNNSSYQNFINLYNRFKNKPKLAKSKTAVKRALAFFAKNKDHIPRNCGGDLDSNISPQKVHLDGVNGIENQRYVLITDYTISEGDRFFLLNLQTGDVKSCPAAHGFGSDDMSACPKKDTIDCRSINRGYRCKIPVRVSNIPESGTTSRGFYLTDKGYNSGQSSFNAGTPKSRGVNALYLRGLIGGVNDNALKRSVVFHRASYAKNSCLRSAGCPAICPELFETYKDKLKKALMYIHTKEDEKRSQPDC